MSTQIVSSDKRGMVIGDLIKHKINVELVLTQRDLSFDVGEVADKGVITVKLLDIYHDPVSTSYISAKDTESAVKVICTVDELGKNEGHGYIRRLGHPTKQEAIEADERISDTVVNAYGLEFNLSGVDDGILFVSTGEVDYKFHVNGFGEAQAMMNRFSTASSHKDGVCGFMEELAEYQINLSQGGYFESLKAHN